MSEHDVKSTPWSIDRTINVPFLLTVLSGVIAGAVWASSIDNRMSNVEDQLSTLPALTVTVARMDERGGASAERLARIERALERQENMGE